MSVEQLRDGWLGGSARLAWSHYTEAGTRDFQVEVGHSERMADALRREGKVHKSVLIDGANHQLDRASDRVRLLTELERFLSRYLLEDVT